MAKTKDLFLNIAANPDMTLEDLASVGLTSENTMLLDRALYASSEKVQDMFRDSEGNFDEQKFNAFYDIAEQSYNILANDEVNLNLINVTAYDSDNIFVDPSKRKQNNKPFAAKLPNPDRLNVGVTRIGKTGPRTLSLDEIAQTLAVLLNPTAVANGEKPIYGSSPNDSWFEDFWDTRVMAAWDEDGTHVDPVTGREIQHKKGDLKLNENGTYYYESLDGRSVYGKRILNKFNTLTTDGSAWNKYDFFDSDSIEQKSIGGSVAKNLALVGSMFIPYVGWGVAAASVVHQSAGLFATLGKMLAGSDSPTLDAIEGWVKSTDRRNLKTEYAQQNMWCWENFIDLIGDTTAQLREQRAIFKFAPGIIKGDFKALSEKAMEDYAKKLAKEGVDNATKLSFKDLVRLARTQNPANADKQLRNLFTGAADIYSAKAQKAVRDYLQSYYKLGEPIAKAYMTAITVQDTFGEAIQAGASDSEATLLTLGYAAAEAALLSTDLGKWIMPELRSERQRYKMIAKKLLELPQETREMSKLVSRLLGETKKAWAKRLFNIGKDIANAEYSTMSKTVGSVLASGLGEGVEEVSEEALADFSKSCFNLVQQLQGDDVRMNAWNHNWDWSEAANRYGMSFAGGILGGGINAAASDYKVNKDLLNMNSQQALLLLVYMTRNDEMNDFWKVINKTTLASPELSTDLNEDGTGYKPGTKENNLDLEAKRALRKQVSMIESIINAENAKLNDGGLLSTLIKADPSLKDLDPVKEYRMRALSNSATAGRFLNEWNTVVSDITKNRFEQVKIMEKYGDTSSEKYSEEDKRELKNRQQELKVLQERKDAMLKGDRTREYVRDALFEMTHAVKEVWDDWCTEIRYAEAKTGKKYSDLSEDEKKELKEQYEQIKNSNQYAEQIHELADIYETLAIQASQGIQASALYYELLRLDSNSNIAILNRIVNKRLGKLLETSENVDLGIALIQEILNDDWMSELKGFDGSQALHDRLTNIEISVNEQIQQLLGDRNLSELTPIELSKIEGYKKEGVREAKRAIYDGVIDKINQTYDLFILLGFIHPETKMMLSNMLAQLAAYAEYKQDEASDETFDDWYEVINTLNEKAHQIDLLSNTPILENLKQFQLSTDIDQNAIELIQYLIVKERLNKSDISSLLFSDLDLRQFTNAKHLLEMYRATIVGARYDNVDIDSIVGFNTTLNEVSGPNETPKLAEIDGQTADLILEDINKLLMRINYIEQVHNLNTGNKYNVQNKTAINKQYILYNKVKLFISTIQKDEYKDEWSDAASDTELADLLAILNKPDSVLSRYSGFGGKFDDRTFTLNPEEKSTLERESIEVQTALHKFLSKHIDGSEASVNKLAKLLTYDNFKGLIRENNGFLNQNSEDIDDSAFIWWLCSTAALDPHQFYNNYRTIIGLEIEGERPIAPIPTQELGVFALTASVVNGDMFSIFGKAIRKSLNEFWETASELERDKIRNEYGSDILYEDSKKIYFKNNDFLPNFDNIIFIEGIAGSGKSTGVLKSWSRLMEKVNPDFISLRIFIAHTDKTKAETLGKSTSFTNFEVHDHDSLLKYISSQYEHVELVKGQSTYVMDKDVQLVDGILRSKWELNQYNANDVPKVIIIDEWSHYDQIELELIQRFALKYGITVITMGDYDLLTPEAEVVKQISDDKNDKLLNITPTRNMTPRIAKLGVSMRTDNEVKNTNVYNMLAWRQSPTDSVELHYYEDDNGIFGDKLYAISGSGYDNHLDSIKRDVLKMITTLKDSSEKIGFIYHDENSELYKWLTTTEGVKQHIQPYLEKDAHGREALYYIIENDRSSGQDALTYFNSVYTGITRSEQGSIIITNNQTMRRAINDKYNKKGLSFKSVQDEQMLPNTFTDEGTRDFSRKRKETFDAIFGNEEVTAFNIKPRTQNEVILNPPSQSYSNDDSDLDTDTSNDQPTPSTSTDTSTDTSEDGGLLPPPENIPSEVYLRMDLNSDENKNRTDESNTTTGEESSDITETEQEPKIKPWIGPFTKGQILYNPYGVLDFQIIDETEKDEYVVKKLSTDEESKFPKSLAHSTFFTKIPEQDRRFNKGDKIVFQKNTVHTISDVKLVDPENPSWVYVINGTELYHEEVLKMLSNGELSVYVEPLEDTATEVPITAYETEGASEYMDAITDEFENNPTEHQPSPISQNGNDVSFKLFGYTFNNLYTADKFDEDGNIQLDKTDELRIDNGYGLYLLSVRDKSYRWKSKAQLEKDIASIRQHLQFSSNDGIIKHLQNLTKISGLSMRWAFISKYGGSGKYSRFKSPKGLLLYMNKEDDMIPSKTLSAIIYDAKGEPILEFPIITFEAPHSIFRAMVKEKIGNDITSLWNFGKKSTEETYQRLTAILRKIASDHANLPGYQSLSDVISMWLFTSNGVQVLDKGWNLHSSMKNLGNFYITSRFSDNYVEHDFKGEWLDLTKHERKDRFISSIMMNNLDKYIDPTTGKSVELFRKYVPYVFISDSPEITSDQEASERYLLQLFNPMLEKTVKVIPVVPPEISVSEYILAMHRLLDGKSKNEPYGNKYTPYRILSAILKSGNAETILGVVKQKTREMVIGFIKELDNIKTNNPIKPGESKLAYKKRIALLLNKVLDRHVAFGKGRLQVVEILRRALVECYGYNQVGSLTNTDSENLRRILQVCDSMQGDGAITGILCHPSLDAGLKGKAIGGFAYKVKVLGSEGDAKYTFPGAGSFRIFGKIDPPTYDLSALFGDIRKWVKRMHKGITVTDSNTGETFTLENVWEFVENDAVEYYLPQTHKPHFDLKSIKSKYRQLLAKLNIRELDIDISGLSACKTEAEAMAKVTDIINKKYLEDNGSFIITDKNGNYKYGNIISDQTPEFKNYKFDNLESIPNGYILRFVNLDTNTIEEIEIELDLSTNSFKVIPKRNPETSGNRSIKDIRTEVETAVRNSFMWKNIESKPDRKAIFEAIFNCYNIEANTVDVETIEQLLAQANLGLASRNVRNTLLKPLEVEQQQDLCINPISISFK